MYSLMGVSYYAAREISGSGPWADQSSRGLYHKTSSQANWEWNVFSKLFDGQLTESTIPVNVRGKGFRSIRWEREPRVPAATPPLRAAQKVWDSEGKNRILKVKSMHSRMEREKQILFLINTSVVLQGSLTSFKASENL